MRKTSLVLSPTPTIHEGVIDSFILTETIQAASDKRHIIMEERIELCVRKCPRFVPKSIWLKLAAYFLTIVIRKK